MGEDNERGLERWRSSLRTVSKPTDHVRITQTPSTLLSSPSSSPLSFQPLPFPAASHATTLPAEDMEVMRLGRGCYIFKGTLLFHVSPMSAAVDYRLSRLTALSPSVVPGVRIDNGEAARRTVLHFRRYPPSASDPAHCPPPRLILPQ